MEHMSTKEKMKGMTFKEKTSYILYYYKLHITIIIVLIAFIASYSMSIISRKDSVLNITLVGNSIDSNKQVQLETKAEDALIKTDKRKKEISFDFIQTSADPRDEISLVATQKLVASIASKDVDILILDTKDFDAYVKQGTIMKLTSIPNFSNVHVPNSSLVIGKVNNLDKADEAYGINAESLPLLKYLNFDSTNKVICIPSNSKHVDKSIEFLKWIYQLKTI